MEPEFCSNLFLSKENIPYIYGDVREFYPVVKQLRKLARLALIPPVHCRRESRGKKIVTFLPFIFVNSLRVRSTLPWLSRRPSRWSG